MRERKRLKRIIRLKERIRDARRGELAEVEARHRVSGGAVERASAEVVRLRGSLCEAGELEARELSHRASLVDSAHRERGAAEVRHREVGMEREARVVALAHAGREVCSLEILDARMREDERRLGARREQALNDEHAARRAG